MTRDKEVLTKEESIARSNAKYQQRTDKAAEKKARDLENSHLLEEMGYEIVYWHQMIDHSEDYPVIDFGTVSLAYKVHVLTNTFMVFYTIRSTKDYFSRPVAREELARGVEQGAYEADNGFTFIADQMNSNIAEEYLVKLYFAQFVMDNKAFFPPKFVKGFLKCRELYGMVN